MAELHSCYRSSPSDKRKHLTKRRSNRIQRKRDEIKESPPALIPPPVARRLVKITVRLAMSASSRRLIQTLYTLRHHSVSSWDEKMCISFEDFNLLQSELIKSSEYSVTTQLLMERNFIQLASIPNRVVIIRDSGCVVTGSILIALSR
jgi:hypothetical protein